MDCPYLVLTNINPLFSGIEKIQGNDGKIIGVGSMVINEEMSLPLNEDRKRRRFDGIHIRPKDRTGDLVR